ncbi:hypothetical protein F4825DRAFT_418819 [Nemania diffusa]|nr:hypothetical protein F4825DRAFT_418819 [Nemania diffusa]
MFKCILFAMLLIIPAWAQNCPAVCVSDPPIQLDAGVSNVSAIVDNTFGRQCQATIYFSDPMFLPITYHFDNISCDGLAVTSFRVPTEVPDGVGCVVWQCAGPNLVTCNNVIITGGSPDDTVQRNQNGTVGCILNATQIQTTLVTVTSSSRTFTTVESSTLTTLTTSTVQELPSPTPSTFATDHWSTHQSSSPTLMPTEHETISTSVTGSSTGHNPSNGPASSQSASGSQGLPDSSTGTPDPSGTGSRSSGPVTPSISATLSSIITTVTVLRTVTSVLSACAQITSI